MTITLTRKSTLTRKNHLCKKTIRPFGLSILDMLITIAIVGILTAISLNSMNLFIEKSSQRALFRQLFHMAILTRTLAVKEETYTTLCASNNGIHCIDNWNNNIIIFSDTNKNEQVDENDVVYRVVPRIKTAPCLKWNSSRHYLQFKPTGASNGTAGNFRFCDNVHNLINKKLVVSFTGRTSLKDL